MRNLAKIVEAVAMIGMIMRPDDGIDGRNLGGQQLLPHVGAGIDQQPIFTMRDQDR